MNLAEYVCIGGLVFSSIHESSNPTSSEPTLKRPSLREGEEKTQWHLASVSDSRLVAHVALPARVLATVGGGESKVSGIGHYELASCEPQA